jgi:hypothetical protein
VNDEGDGLTRIRLTSAYLWFRCPLHVNSAVSRARSSTFPASSHACHDWPLNRRRAQVGFTNQARRVPDPAHRHGRNIRLFSQRPQLRGPLSAHRGSDRGAAGPPCMVDGEANVCGDGGLAEFDLTRAYATNASAVLCALDLLEVNGEDVPEPIEDRKRRLAGLLRIPHDGTALNEVGHLQARVRAELRGHRMKAVGVPVSGRPLSAMAQDQES